MTEDDSTTISRIAVSNTGPLISAFQCQREDILGARDVAQTQRLSVVGFAGLLIRGARAGLLSSEAARDALTIFRQQGTRYTRQFIAEVYRGLKEGES